MAKERNRPRRDKKADDQPLTREAVAGFSMRECVRTLKAHGTALKEGTSIEDARKAVLDVVFVNDTDQEDQTPDTSDGGDDADQSTDTAGADGSSDSDNDTGDGSGDDVTGDGTDDAGADQNDATAGDTEGSQATDETANTDPDVDSDLEEGDAQEGPEALFRHALERVHTPDEIVNTMQEVAMADLQIIVNPSRDNIDGSIRFRSTGATLLSFDFGNEANTSVEIVEALRAAGFEHDQTTTLG